VSGARFSFRNTFLFTRKGFRLPKIRPLQSESGGIKSEYAFLNFCKVLILFRFVFFFLGCYSFRSAYALCPVPCAVSENQKQIGKGASSG
jgi:hypothetical protein